MVERLNKNKELDDILQDMINQTCISLNIPIEVNDITQEMGITAESIKEKTLEEFKENFEIFKMADPVSAWKLLEAFGYDLWFDNV